MTWIRLGAWCLFCLILGLVSGDIAKLLNIDKRAFRVILVGLVLLAGWPVSGWIFGRPK